MVNYKLQAKMDRIKSKTFLIEGKKETILDCFEEGKYIKVITENFKRVFNYEEFTDWTNKLIWNNVEAAPAEKMEPAVQRPLQEMAKVTPPDIPTFAYQPSFNSSVFQDLRKILMENIEKVQDNKDYIPQATVVKDNVQSIIDLTKNEIEYVKILDRLNR